MCSSERVWIAVAIACMSLLSGAFSGVIATVPELGSARVVFQTNYGDIEFGFYPSVAPKTVEHIFKLVRLGCYNTNHFFRVDKGFVAQVADVAGGRTAPMNEVQRLEAEKTIVGEFSDVKHVRGILSMGRYSDPDSAQSSFSILLGDAPHLDGQYAIFGKVTKGDETLRKLEQVPTRTEGIFVMPTERITILSTYYYDTEAETCEEDRLILKRRLTASAVEIEKQQEPKAKMNALPYSSLTNHPLFDCVLPSTMSEPELVHANLIVEALIDTSHVQHVMGRNATKLGDPFLCDTFGS
ncbi:UNVERIFIED_CONTAM: Peptidyl-prolyl cis-trans isomerase CYP23 [Sesamum latifolium]|uniref:Peptidyl-prolyl cis-trans isomerase n=1 Tax=Sesamum latifolium TaxID=2727402 RepID=A0AAW2V134_9LAMI